MSIGNLPSQAEVLIKITYVAEVAVEGELINFHLPGSVAPWEKDPALAQETQVGETLYFVLKTSTHFMAFTIINVDLMLAFVLLREF